MSKLNRLKKTRRHVATLLFSSAAIPFLIFISCNKSSDNGCSPESPDKEAAAIVSFCAGKQITPIVDSNGIYYQIIDPGSGIRPTVNSVVNVNYSATLLNGQVVDTSANTTAVSFALNQVIEGWRIAIPYIQKGGHIKFVLPSIYAYGCTGNQAVPPNAPIYFDVTLKDVTQ